MNNKHLFIKIANCTLKIEYLSFPLCLNLIKDFEVINTKNFDYKLNFIGKSIIIAKNTFSLPNNISLRQFQFFLRELLQDYFDKTKKGFFMHCSAIQYNKTKKAYLFLGPNRAGKSTIAQLFKKKHQILADDSGIICKENEKFYLYQTPFAEKNKITKSNNRFILTKIFFLKKANKCSLLRSRNKNEIIDLLIKQLWTDKKRQKKQLEMLIALANSTDQFYKLSFSRNKKELFPIMD